jgi:hypothetical protein
MRSIGLQIHKANGYYYYIVDWERVQEFSQNGITWLSNALAHIPSTVDTTHSGTRVQNLARLGTVQNLARLGTALVVTNVTEFSKSRFTVIVI